jgi:hypothetical protein
VFSGSGRGFPAYLGNATLSLTVEGTTGIVLAIRIRSKKCSISSHDIVQGLVEDTLNGTVSLSLLRLDK